MIAIKRISPNLGNKLWQKGAPKLFLLLLEQQQQHYSNPTSYYIINSVAMSNN
jgi:hypothetical protein